MICLFIIIIILDKDREVMREKGELERGRERNLQHYYNTCEVCDRDLNPGPCAL